MDVGTESHIGFQDGRNLYYFKLHIHVCPYLSSEKRYKLDFNCCTHVCRCKDSNDIDNIDLSDRFNRFYIHFQLIYGYVETVDDDKPMTTTLMTMIRQKSDLHPKGKGSFAPRAT